MSTVYNLEPPTRGKVILKTSLGNVDVELWPKEAPLAVRNFVQLSLEGYYDGSIFHRMIKDFLVQGGDPTGTGSGSESIYGRPFKDEFHSRLRFSHRGLLACANQNEKDTNGSQFFITLDAASWLDKKNTIFGRVAGDTIYNLLKFNDLDVDEDDRPVDPPVLLEVEVVWNPMEDIVPRITAEQKRAMEEAKRNAQNKKLKRTGKRKLALLSFGEEAEQEEQELLAAPVLAKIRSAHDVLEDERLEKAPPSETAPTLPSAELLRVRERLAEKKMAGLAKQASKKTKQESTDQLGVSKREEGVEGGGRSSKRDFASLMRDKMESRRKAMGDARKPREEGDNSIAVKPEQGAASEPPSPAQGRGDTEEHLDRRKGRSEREDKSREHHSSAGSSGDHSDRGGSNPEVEGARRKAELEDRKTESRKRTLGRVVTETQVENADLLKPYQIMRETYKQRKRIIGHREKETLARLDKFKQLLKDQKVAGTKAEPAAGAKPPAVHPESNDGEDKGYSGKVSKDMDHRKYMPAAWRVDDYLYNHHDEDEDDQGIAGLRGHVLKFSKDAKKDDMARSDNVDDYVVFDPLLEKGKGKFSRTQQKEKKRNNEWAGQAVT